MIQLFTHILQGCFTGTGTISVSKIIQEDVSQIDKYQNTQQKHNHYSWDMLCAA